MDLYFMNHIAFFPLGVVALILSLLIAFFSTIYFAKKLIPFFKDIGLVGRDINKRKKVEVAEAGGLIVFLSFSLSFLFLVFVVAFLYFIFPSYFDATGVVGFVAKSLAVFSSMSLMFVVGFFEDLYNLSKDEVKIWKGKVVEKKKGFSQKSKFVLPLLASVPIIIWALLNNYTAIYVPFLNKWLYLGIVYSLIVVPIGIVGASNALNLLAGLNGLEASLASVTYLTLSIFSYFALHNFFLTSFSLIFAIISLVFLIFNYYPSRVFPGDSYTYMAGNGIAIIAILSRAEYFALSLFVLWFVELFLKLRSRMKAESFGKINKEGKLERPYDKIYSITHIFMNGRRGEREIVRLIVGLQTLICLISLAIFLLF